MKLRRQKVEPRPVCTMRWPSSLAQLAVAQCPVASPGIACRSRIGRTLNQVKGDKVNKGRVRPQTRQDGAKLDGGWEMPPRVRRSVRPMRVPGSQTYSIGCESQSRRPAAGGGFSGRHWSWAVTRRDGRPYPLAPPTRRATGTAARRRKGDGHRQPHQRLERRPKQQLWVNIAGECACNEASRQQDVQVPGSAGGSPAPENRPRAPGSGRPRTRPDLSSSASPLPRSD